MSIVSPATCFSSASALLCPTRRASIIPSLSRQRDLFFNVVLSRFCTGLAPTTDYYHSTLFLQPSHFRASFILYHSQPFRLLLPHSASHRQTSISLPCDRLQDTIRIYLFIPTTRLADHWCLSLVTTANLCSSTFWRVFHVGPMCVLPLSRNRSLTSASRLVCGSGSRSLCCV